MISGQLRDQHTFHNLQLYDTTTGRDPSRHFQEMEEYVTHIDFLKNSGLDQPSRPHISIHCRDQWLAQMLLRPVVIIPK